jgi:hypothetical protein
MHDVAFIASSAACTSTVVDFQCFPSNAPAAVSRFGIMIKDKLQGHTGHVHP